MPVYRRQGVQAEYFRRGPRLKACLPPGGPEREIGRARTRLSATTAERLRLAADRVNTKGLACKNPRSLGAWPDTGRN